MQTTVTPTPEIKPWPEMEAFLKQQAAMVQDLKQQGLLDHTQTAAAKEFGQGIHQQLKAAYEAETVHYYAANLNDYGPRVLRALSVPDLEEMVREARYHANRNAAAWAKIILPSEAVHEAAAASLTGQVLPSLEEDDGLSELEFCGCGSDAMGNILHEDSKGSLEETIASVEQLLGHLSAWLGAALYLAGPKLKHAVVKARQALTRQPWPVRESWDLHTKRRLAALEWALQSWYEMEDSYIEAENEEILAVLNGRDGVAAVVARQQAGSPLATTGETPVLP